MVVGFSLLTIVSVKPSQNSKKIHLTTKEIKGPNPKTPLTYDGISCKALVLVLQLNCT